jgi:AcrR family transcriptional regulator
MDGKPGLREKKKRHTRQLIAESALRLFIERGFDEVTVAEVAEAADVSEGTVFNYFPTKEDLFFGGRRAFESEVIEAVRGRAPGVSVIDAFRHLVLNRDRLLHLTSDQGVNTVRVAARLIASSADRILDGDSGPELAATLIEQAKRGFARLDIGLHDYGER